MDIVISHAYTWDAEHTDAYIKKSAAFNDWLGHRPGFVSRQLVRDQEDPTHLLNLRLWRSVEDYEAIIHLPEYRSHIEDLSTHVDPARYEGGYVRLYGEIVSTT